jgi:hypothetical protein
MRAALFGNHQIDKMQNGSINYLYDLFEVVSKIVELINLCRKELPHQDL